MCVFACVTAATDVDDVLVVADEQVSEDAGLIEVTQADHVLHAVDGGRVHWFDVGGTLRTNPVFLHTHIVCLLMVLITC